MNDCTRIETELTPLLDGELEPAVAVAVRRHLADCPRCARRLATLETVRAVVAGARPEGSARAADGDAPGWAALERRLLAADEERRPSGRPAPGPRSRRRWMPGRGPWKLAASILAAAVLAGSLWIVEHRVTGVVAGTASPGSEAVAPGPFPDAGRSPSVRAAEISPPIAREPSELEDEPCASAEDCGSGGRRIWPAFPL